jgi:UDP-N-acetylmuramate--alanine ligase
MAAAGALRRRIVVVFQPHRYSRTAALMDAFGPAMAGADRVVLTDIYAAGEDPIPGVTLSALAESVRRGARCPVDEVPLLDDVAPAVARIARPGDVVITLGAGSIGAVPDRLLDLLARPGREQT